MQENKSLDFTQIQILDSLNQIKVVNKMITLHEKESQDNFMVNQYIDRKNRFLQELKELLSGYEIEVKIKPRAA